MCSNTVFNLTKQNVLLFNGRKAIRTLHNIIYFVPHKSKEKENFRNEEI
jgi:hypothetical protein